jgi:hypothetical protein
VVKTGGGWLATMPKLSCFLQAKGKSYNITLHEAKPSEWSYLQLVVLLQTKHLIVLCFISFSSFFLSHSLKFLCTTTKFKATAK